MRWNTWLLTAFFLLAVAGAQALADEPKAGPVVPSSGAAAAAPAPVPSKIDTGDTAWMLVSTALVMLMTPGLAFFYGGMTRRKNVLGTIMQSFIALGVVSVQWILFGYSLAFGPDVHHLIGSLDWVGLRGVGLDPNPDYAPTIPHQAYMIFQMMFAVITPALITGAFAERVKFSSYLVFILLWSTLVYDPMAHWVWGVGGWIHTLGALDFAGGLVVHISSGIAALAAALVVGKRRGYGHEPMPPHNLTMTILGAALLWFGWFGFNAGSAVASGSLATSAFVATHAATAAGALAWMAAEWIYRGTPSVLGAASGAVAGLVAITPASGFVGPLPALVIGGVIGILSFSAVNLKARLGYDDSLDVVGVHGVGGTWGALATGLFASKLINPAGGDGLFFGHPSLLGVQAVSVAASWTYSFAVSFVLLKVIDWTMGLRVAEEDEVEGLDLTLHGESGYNFGIGGSEFPGAKRIVAPPHPQPAAVGSGEGKPFLLEIVGIDEHRIARWWDTLCGMDWQAAPEEFRDIFGYVSRLKGTSLCFWKGAPEGLKGKVTALLAKSGLTGAGVRVVR